MSWSKRIPKPPELGCVSDYYWYYDPIENDKCVMEVWANRDVSRFEGLWWRPKVEEPIEPPPEIKTKKKKRRKRTQ